MIALNVYVVTSKETPAFLKWDAMSIIFANGNSRSGSGSGFEAIKDSTRNNAYSYDQVLGKWGCFGSGSAC